MASATSEAAKPRVPVAAGRLQSWMSSTSLVATCAAMLTLAIGWFGLDEIERRSRADLESRLSASVDTGTLALQLWLDQQRNTVRSWAGDEGMRTEVEALLASASVQAGERDGILRSDELRRLRRRLDPVCRSHGYVGFVILDRQGRQVGALLDDAVGKVVEPRVWESVRESLEDKVPITRPFVSDIPLPDADGRLQPGRPTMLSAAAIRDATDSIVAVLAFRLQPDRQFVKSLEAARPGDTGEAYAFDGRGLMLSDSRFNDHLRRVGLLPDDPASRALLTLELRDPGGNLLKGFRPSAQRESWPLTRMAASATAGENAVDAVGYRDYRGVPVVGAWRWLPDYGFGITHEIDAAEAFAPLYAIRAVFLGWLGLFGGALGISLVLHAGRRRAEKRHSRTQEALAKLDITFRQVLDSATQVAIFATDQSGTITVFNTGAEQMLQYRAGEMIGRQTPAVFHLESEVEERGRQLTREFGRPIQGFDVFVEYARRGSFEKREWTCVRKDGSRLTVDLVVTALCDAAGHATGFLGIAQDVTQRKRASELFRQTVHASPFGVILVGDAGRIKMINAAAAAMFGYSDEEVRERPVEMLVPRRYRDAYVGFREDCLAAPELRVMEAGRRLQGLRKDGHEFDIEIGLNPMQTEDGVFVVASIVDITAKVHAERALRESRERMDLALGSAMVGTWDWNLAEDTVIWDDYIHPLFGLKPGEFGGSYAAFEELLHPDERVRVREEVRRAVYEDAKYSSEFRVIWPDGSHHVIGARGKVYKNDVGEPIRMTGVCWDESDRRQWEDRFRLIVDGITNGILMVGGDGAIVLANPSAERMFGYDSGELIGRAIEVLVPESHRADHPQARHEFFRAPRARYLGDRRNLHGVRKDGREFDVEIALCPIEAAQGPFVVAIVVDITERLKGELAAMRLAAVVESSDDAIISKELDGIIFGWNRGAERVFGYSREEMVGQPMNRLLPPDKPNEEREILERLRQGERLDHFETVRVRKDGRAIDVSTTISPIRDSLGRVTGIASISRDITDRKLAAEMLRRSAAELARSNVELEQFAYIASHDLQEPLRKIQAFGDMLASSAGDALGTEERDYLSRMCRAAARMRTLIDDLLDLSRVATRGRPFEPVDLSEVAREVLEDLETRLVESGAAVRVGDLPRVMADPTQMRQLLQNLVGNALKYRKPDVAPEILVERLADCGPGQVAFAVRDNGIGFDPKYADRIFQPFQRLHGRGEYEGTGMGLAICRKIVERHEGTIVADARPGAGAVFRVVLPFCPFRPGAVDGESR